MYKRRSYPAFTFPKAFCLLASPVFRRFFCAAIWLPFKQLVINPLLFSHTLISHKWKGFATWFISICCTAKYSALSPPHQPLLHHLLLAVSKDQLKLYFLYRVEERCSAVKQQWIFNKLTLFASAGYLSLYLHTNLGPHFPVFHRTASTWGTLTLQPWVNSIPSTHSQWGVHLSVSETMLINLRASLINIYFILVISSKRADWLAFIIPVYMPS